MSWFFSTMTSRISLGTSMMDVLTCPGTTALTRTPDAAPWETSKGGNGRANSCHIHSISNLFLEIFKFRVHGSRSRRVSICGSSIFFSVGAKAINQLEEDVFKCGPDCLEMNEVDLERHADFSTYTCVVHMCCWLTSVHRSFPHRSNKNCTSASNYGFYCARVPP